MSSVYQQYQHVEKLGSDEVNGLLEGECYIFPKIDGTNAHVWKDCYGKIHYGSRKRELSLDADNAGFMRWAMDCEWLQAIMERLPYDSHVYGEWLVPHSLKTYTEDAWRQFYIFDVIVDGKYIHYKYLGSNILFHHVPCTRIIINPKLMDIKRCLAENTYLIQDGEGCGEGVVVKNYDFVNKFGRVCSGKMVTNEFKERHTREMGAPVSRGTSYIEEKIVNDFLSKDIIDKAFLRTIGDEGWNARKIPQLLGVIWHDFVTEQIWDILKANKNPQIDFKVLQRFCNKKIKEARPDLFNNKFDII